jgi:type I restriction enzyme S subunit
MAGDGLPDGWRLVKLGELGEVNRGRSRHRPRYAEHLYGGPYPFIQTGDIKNSGGRITSYQQTYSEAGLAQSRMWPANTMCITIAANIAETAILAFPACFPDSVVGFIAEDSKCEIRFVEYTFRFLRQQLQREASGSVQDNINLETLDRLRFPLPPLPEQRAIAHILGTLDDKIELNRRMSETLEAMARALFKSWFVDFDPVRAKAEGRARQDGARSGQPRTPQASDLPWPGAEAGAGAEGDPGLPQPLADLFPDSFEDSELGEIPRGWEVARFADTIEIVGGGTPKTSVAEYWGGDIPWFSVVDAPTDSEVWVLDTEKKVTRAGVENSSTRVLPVGTTIISARGTVGRVALVGVPMAMNQSCYGLRGLAGTQGFFSYYSTRELVTRLQQHAHGSVFDTITRDTLAGVSVVVPPSELVEHFENGVGPSLDRIRAGLLEARTLANARDALLPKLISGELRVQDAERFLETASP